MLGFSVLLTFYALGIVLQAAFHIPVPANVIGMILFTLCLFLRLVKIEWVEEASEFLIKHMLLLFVPLTVGTMAFFDLIGEQLVAILISLFVSTFGVLLVTGWTAKLAGGKKKEGDTSHDVS